MSSSDALRETLEHFRQQRVSKLGELRQLETIINRLEREIGEDATDFSSQSDVAAGPEQNEGFALPPSAVRRPESILPDEFFGLTQSEAARRYLKKVKHAVSVEEVLESLRRGGCEVGGADPKKTLYISMIRDTRNFIKLPNGLFGLVDFYPDRKIRPEKKEKPKPRKRKPQPKTEKTEHATEEK